MWKEFPLPGLSRRWELRSGSGGTMRGLLLFERLFREFYRLKNISDM